MAFKRILRSSFILLLLGLFSAGLFCEQVFSQTAATSVVLSVKVHGIGNGGDNVSPQSTGNLTPLHTTRTVTVNLSDSANRLVVTKTGTVSYNATSGMFQGSVNLGSVTSGVYTVTVKTDQTLRRSVPGIITLTASQTVTLPTISLITGDVNNDNLLSIIDYNMLLDCFSDISPAKNCSDSTKKLATDLSDDGAVNQFDYNLLLRELSVQGGDNVDVTPQPTSVITPTTKPVATPTTVPSGTVMPVGDLPGWKQIFTEDFTTPVTLGNFPGTVYKNKFTVYLDGWPDTAGKKGSPSRYYPSKVITVSNGILNKYMHTENGFSMGAAILPILPSGGRDQLYGKYTVRFRADSLPGYKTAWLLWPQSNTSNPDGEIDFPEGDLASTIHAYMHHINPTSGGDQEAFSTGVSYANWHIASTEWTAGKVVFILDGKVIGTSTTRVPNKPMHWVLQSESCLPTCPAASTAGNVQIDWVVVYAKI